MHRLFTVLAMSLLLLIAASASALAGAKILNTIKTETTPIDVASADNGNWTYVLSAGGKLAIYSATGQLSDTVTVDPSADRIAVAGNDGKTILVASSKNRTIQLVSLAFTVQINTEGSPFLGNPDAPVTLVVFSDFQCPYCAKLVQVIENVALAYPETVKVVFKHFPLRSHRYASLAAIAAIAAQQQGKFWEFHDRLFAAQNELDQDKIMAVAQDIGLDMKRFTSDVGGEAARNQLARDLEDGQTAGVHGTPTVFIDGRQPEKLDFESIKKLIDSELQLNKPPKK